MDPMGTSPEEKFKRIKWYSPNPALINWVELPRKVQPPFTYAAVGKPYLGVPILYLDLAGNWI